MCITYPIKPDYCVLWAHFKIIACKSTYSSQLHSSEGPVTKKGPWVPKMRVLRILLKPLIAPTSNPTFSKGVTQCLSLALQPWRWPNVLQKKHLGDEGVAEEREWDCPVYSGGHEGPKLLACLQGHDVTLMAAITLVLFKRQNSCTTPRKNSFSSQHGLQTPETSFPPSLQSSVQARNP